MMCVGRAEKQKRVDVCVGFLNDNKNKAEEMRQVVEEAVMILMLLTAGLRKNIGFGNWWEGSYWRVVELEIILKDVMHDVLQGAPERDGGDEGGERGGDGGGGEGEQVGEQDFLHYHEHYLRHHSCS